MAYTFDGVNKLIICKSGTTTIPVPDLYSRWKEWVALSDNAKYDPAFRIVGGDIIDAAAGTLIPAYTYLANGWRIRPQEASHILTVKDGILLVDGGGDPFVATLGTYTVGIRYFQPVQAVGYSTSGGGGSFPTADEIAAAVIGAMGPIQAGSQVNSDELVGSVDNSTSEIVGHLIDEPPLTGYLEQGEDLITGEIESAGDEIVGQVDQLEDEIDGTVVDGSTPQILTGTIEEES